MNKEQFDALAAELRAQGEKADKEREQYGYALSETKAKIEALQKQYDAMDAKLCQERVRQDEGTSFEKELKENEGLSRLMHDKKGQAVIQLSSKGTRELLERKTTITTGTGSLGAAPTAGVIPIEYEPGLVREARQQLRIRDVLASRPTEAQLISFVKVNSPMTTASPQTEASDKKENAVTFTVVTEKVRTIATWVPASRQVLDDMTELMSFLQETLPYYVNIEEELQLLSGDNTGENLHGLITQATAFDTTLLSNTKGWNNIDQIGRVIQQITAAKELAPTFVVLHPNDWWAMRLLKDSYGRYILGDPQNGAMTTTGFGVTTPRLNIFDLDVVPTTSITAGTFLVGSGSPIASVIRDRMDMQIDISTQHSDYFVKNLVAIRAEKRVVLVTKRPASYITGTFNNSPA